MRFGPDTMLGALPQWVLALAHFVGRHNNAWELNRNVVAAPALFLPFQQCVRPFSHWESSRRNGGEGGPIVVATFWLEKGLETMERRLNPMMKKEEEKKRS